MRIETWLTGCRGLAGLLAATALLLVGCGDSGSASRSAAGLSGSTTAAQVPQVGGGELAKKGGGEVEDEDDESRGRDGKPDNRKDRGRHRGRPSERVEGAVSGLTGPRCSGLTVAGVPIKVTGATHFSRTNCRRLANGNIVRVDGQPLGNGSLLARDIRLISGSPAPVPVPVANLTVTLVSGGTVIDTDTTSSEGKFEFEDVTPGTYSLQAAVNGASCTKATGIVLVAQQNEVEGKLVATGSPVTCGNLVLAKLEVKQGS